MLLCIAFLEESKEIGPEKCEGTRQQFNFPTALGHFVNKLNAFWICSSSLLASQTMHQLEISAGMAVKFNRSYILKEIYYCKKIVPLCHNDRRLFSHLTDKLIVRKNAPEFRHPTRR